jgi:short-subunit dehydrogenase
MSKSQYKVVITGATGGIGQHIVKLLAPEASSFVLIGLYEQELIDLKSKLQLKNAHIVSGDINDAGVRQKVKILCESLGGVDLLINNAGINDFNLFENQDEKVIRDIINVNLLAPMLLTHALLPLLKKEHKAQVINMGSIFGYIGYPGFSMYCVSKFGLRGFAQALNRELGDTYVRVRYFAPRATQTKFNNDKIVLMNNELGNTMDEPEVVAQEFIKFLSKSQSEKKIGMKESFFVLMNKLIPAIPEKSIIKQLPIIKKYLSN